MPGDHPKPTNVTYYRTPAAAQREGYRRCRRCRPDATPGSPEWNIRGDVVGRVMRLVADGAVERDGVAGLATGLGYSERHLNRLVTEELGAGILAIARAQRTHTARILLETTDMAAAEVAWAAGSSSIRSFNDTVGAVYGTTPTGLRGARRGTVAGEAPLVVRLSTRAPFDAATVLEFLGGRAVPGLESFDGETYRRTLDLPARARDGGRARGSRRDRGDLPAGRPARPGPGGRPGAAHAGPRRRPAGRGRSARRRSDARPARRARPGLRASATVDPYEIMVRAIVGQQVSVTGARTVVGRLVAAHGQPLAVADPELTHVFPSAERLAEVDPGSLPMPRARGRSLVGVCRAIADSEVCLDAGADRPSVLAALLARPGIGPWTAGYVAMRGLGDPDVMLAGDLGVRHAVQALGGDPRPRAVQERAHRWRPWRSYAVGHLWASLADQPRADGPNRGPDDSARTGRC